MDETTRALTPRTGLDIVGCYAFGRGPAHADELLAFVAETVDVVTGRLEQVTPAIAWGEGEDDGTLESWLAGHRGWALQLGVADPGRLEVLLEREGQPVGTLSFRPHPGGEAVVFSLDTVDGDSEAELRRAFAELGRRHDWTRRAVWDQATEPSGR